jgi:hypothetical protein
MRPGATSGLEPGAHRLDVFAAGLSHAQIMDLEARLEEPLRRDVELTVAGVVQGSAPGRAFLGVRRPGEEDFRAIAILGSEGLFTFAGLPAGAYEVALWIADAPPPAELTDRDAASTADAVVHAEQRTDPGGRAAFRVLRVGPVLVTALASRGFLVGAAEAVTARLDLGAGEDRRVVLDLR